MNYTKGEYPCGCKITQTEMTIHGVCKIEYCPLHKAAPDMHRVLHEIIETTLFDSTPPTPTYWLHWRMRAVKVLAKIKGEE